MSWLSEVIVFVWIVPVTLTIILPLVILGGWGIARVMRAIRYSSSKEGTDKQILKTETSLS